MPLTLSIHPITGTRQSAPDLDGLLRDAAVQVARIMSRELAVLFGVGCTDVRVRSAFGEAVELRHRSDEALERDARGFVRDIAMGRHGVQVAPDPAVVADREHGAGLIAHESDAVEEATIADINEVGLTLELPSRTGHRASPGDVTRLRYRDGSTVDLRWPTLPQLLGGHF